MPHASLPLIAAGAVLAGVLTGMPGGASAGQTAPQAPASFVPGPGADTMRSHCTICHPATMITARRMNQKQWAGTIDQMIAKGAPVSDEDYPVILAYLARNYGAEK